MYYIEWPPIIEKRKNKNIYNILLYKWLNAHTGRICQKEPMSNILPILLHLLHTHKILNITSS